MRCNFIGSSGTRAARRREYGMEIISEKELRRGGGEIVGLVKYGV